MSRFNASPQLSVVIGFALGVVVPGWKFWVPSITSDEVATLVVSQRPFGQLLLVLENWDVVHGCYYSIMHFWLMVAGYTPVTLRLPSVLAMGVVAGGLAFLVARRAGFTFGLVAAGLWAFLPTATFLATEARPIALSLAAITVSLVFLDLSLDHGGWRWWVYGGAAAVSIWLNIYSVFALIAFVVLVFGRQRWRPYGVATGLAGLAGIPLLVLAKEQRGQVDWIKLTRIRDYVRGFDDMLGPQTSAFEQWWWIGLAILAAAFVAVRWPRVRLAAVGVAWLLVPKLLLVSFGRFIPLYTPRYTMIGAPGFVLFLTAGVVAAAGLFAAGRGRAIKTDDISVRLATTPLQRWLSVALAIAVLGGTALVSRPALARMHQPTVRSHSVVVANAVAAAKRPNDCLLLIPGSTYGGGLRYIAHAYPTQFSGLRDLTYGTLAPGQIWESDVLLPERLDTLRSCSGVVFLTKKPNSEWTKEVLGLVQNEGFKLKKREDFPGATLMELRP